MLLCCFFPSHPILIAHFVAFSNKAKQEGCVPGTTSGRSLGGTKRNSLIRHIKKNTKNILSLFKTFIYKYIHTNPVQSLQGRARKLMRLKCLPSAHDRNIQSFGMLGLTKERNSTNEMSAVRTECSTCACCCQCSTHFLSRRRPVAIRVCVSDCPCRMQAAYRPPPGLTRTEATRFHLKAKTDSSYK